MATKYIFTNDITIRGRLVFQKRDDEKGRTYFVIQTKNGNRDSSLSFSYYGNFPKLADRTFVEVKAQVMEYVSKATNKKRQRLLATDIKQDSTLIEKKYESIVDFPIKGRFFDEPSATAVISGIIQNVIKEDKWYRIYIQTKSNANGEEKDNIIKLDYYEKDRNPAFAKGAFIYTVCVVNGKKVTHQDGTNVEHLDLVIIDCVVLSANELSEETIKKYDEFMEGGITKNDWISFLFSSLKEVIMFHLQTQANDLKREYTQGEEDKAFEFCHKAIENLCYNFNPHVNTAEVYFSKEFKKIIQMVMGVKNAKNINIVSNKKTPTKNKLEYPEFENLDFFKSNKEEIESLLKNSDADSDADSDANNPFF